MPLARVLPFVLLGCACGAAARSPGSIGGDRAAAESSSAPGAQADASGVASAQAASEALPGYAAMEARGASLAPGMRVAARKESVAGERVELVRAGARDVCVRVAFESAGPVTAKLLDGASHVLAAADAPSTEGVLGEAGPVCIRKGDQLTGLAQGTGRVRWVAWQAL